MTAKKFFLVLTLTMIAAVFAQAQSNSTEDFFRHGVDRCQQGDFRDFDSATELEDGLAI